MDRQKRTRKRKKLTKAKLIKGINGSISILLCILMTPLLTVSLGLVEYARYQQAMEVTDEVYELAGISALSDYDQYIHNRFGLLATSQVGELGAGAGGILTDNIGVLGNQVTLSSPSISGANTLADTETLKRQVVDFSELTVTTAVINSDLGLEELLEKLNGFSEFEDVMKTVNGIADLADTLTAAVEKLKALEESLADLKNAIDNSVSLASSLATKIGDLYKKLGDNGIALPQNASAEEIESAITSFSETYLDDITDVYKTAKSLMTNLDSIEPCIEDAKTAANDFITEVKKAADAADAITKTNGVDSNGKVSKPATDTLGDILDQMAEVAEESVTTFVEEAEAIAMDTVDQIIDTAIENAGLSEVADRYNKILNGDYFALPLSDTAKQDIVDLLKAAKTVYDEQNGEALVSYFKSKFVPQIDLDPGELRDEIVEVIKNADKALSDVLEDSMISMITSLVNIVNGLFDLDVFYDPQLNAFVNVGQDRDNPYQTFLDELGNMLEAVEELTGSRKEEGSTLEKLYNRVVGGLTALGKLMTSAGKLFNSIFEIARDSVANIANLSGMLLGGNVQGAYESLLISGYMRHNLPCRVDFSDQYSYNSNTNSVSMALDSVALTGFKYDDIARPAAYGGQSGSSGNGFRGLAKFLNNMKAGGGSDTMFRGAELEYIRAGTNSEIANQVVCFFDIYFLRLLLDLPSVLFLDTEVTAVAGSATIAAWAVYLIYIVLEPFCDTLILVNGEGVPFVKTDCWLTGSGIFGFISKLGSAVLGPELEKNLNNYVSQYAKGSDNGGNGDGDKDYKTHMLILLLMYVQPEKQIERLQDIIEMEATEYYRGQTDFNMAKTYTAVKVKATVTFNPLVDLGKLGGGGSQSLTSYSHQQMVSY